MKPKTNSKPSISILLVEDDKDTLGLLAKMYSIKFPDVVLHTANNGRAGLELFNAHTPDIVITDVNMPEMGGIQMAAKIREIKPEAKIIVLTADTGKATLEDAVENDFEINHYILKPVNFGQLFAAIEQCLGEIAQQS